MRKIIVVASLLAGTVAAAAMWQIASAATTTPQMLAEAAYQAMGGDKLAAVRALSFDATLQQWDPGESETVADPLKPDWGKATLHEVRDLQRGVIHTEWQRPKASPGLRMYSETYSADGGYVTGVDENGGVTKRAI